MDRILRVDAPPNAVPIFGDPKAFIYQILDMRKLTFLLIGDFMVDVRCELTTNDPCSAVVAICEGLINSPLG